MSPENKPASRQNSEAPEFDQYAGPPIAKRLETRAEERAQNAERIKKEKEIENKISEFAKSPEVVSALEQVQKKAQKSNSEDIIQALKALSEYDSVDTKNADDDLLKEIAQVREEKAIWFAKQKELENQQIAEAERIAKLNTGLGQVTSAVGGRAGQTGWIGGGRATVGPDSMAGIIAAQAEHKRQLASRGVSQETIDARAMLKLDREQRAKYLGQQAAAQAEQQRIGPPPILPEKNESPIYDADLNTGRTQVSSATAERAGQTGWTGGGLRTRSGSFAEVQADSEAQAEWEAHRVESQETRDAREMLKLSREQIAKNVGQEAAARVEDARTFHKEFNEGWRLPKGEAPKPEKPKSVWGRFVDWLKKPD